MPTSFVGASPFVLVVVSFSFSEYLSQYKRVNVRKVFVFGMCRMLGAGWLAGVHNPHTFAIPFFNLHFFTHKPRAR